MQLQLIIALILVLAAAAYLGWTAIKTWRKSSKGGCCSTANDTSRNGVTFIPSDSVGLRRNGES